MYVFEIVAHCFFVKLLFVLYFVSITTYEDISHMDHVENSEVQELNTEDFSNYLSQKIIIFPCPDNFQNHGDLCVYFKYNTSYPPECPYEETVPFNTYIDQISLTSPIWMPVRRDNRKNGIGLFYWMEPNSVYKSPFDPCRDSSCIFINKSEPSINNCVIYHNRSSMEAIPCDQRATAVCAYDHLQKKTKSFCSQIFSTSCKQSDFSTKSKCFCESPGTNLEKAEFLIPYQNLVYHSMTDDMCYMGLKNTGTAFIWTSSNIIVNYSYWATDTYPTVGGNAFGAISSDGWTLKKTDSELTCTIFQQDIPEHIYSDEMFLDFNDTTGSFILQLTNSTNWFQSDRSEEPLIFCFSDASAESILEMIDTNYQEDTGEFWFKPISHQSGNYWCEGFLYPELELKTSNEYQLKADMEEYVIILKFSYVKGSDPLSQSNLERYKQLLDQSLAKPSFFTRIFKITQIDEEISQISINFHVTTDEMASEIINWSIIRDALRDRQENFTLDKLLNAHFCLPMVVSHSGQQISWLKTYIGEVADKPFEGWCVDSEGYILKRRCEGNFVDGADWEDFRQICTIVSSVNNTINLTSIVASENPTSFLEQMVELTTNYNDFSSTDVALVSDFLEQLSNVSTTDIESVCKIVNNLGRISQSKLVNRATKIIHSVDEIVRKSSDYNIILGDTLSIASFGSISNNTLIFIKDPNTMEIKFSEVSRPEDIDKEEHFDSALFLNQTILVRSSEILSVLIYSNPIFFGENIDSDSTRTIYRILSPHSHEELGASIIYNNNFDINAVIFHRCSSWTYEPGESIGYWKYQRRAEYYRENLVCNLDNWDYSRLQSSMFSANNITTELIRIKNFPFSSQYSKLSELRDLLEEFDCLLQPSDLYHISEILSRVETVVIEEFNLVADIVDSISNMNRTILYESLPNVHDLILNKLTKIMESYETTIEISRRNFFLLVFFMNLTSDTEFVINTCTEFCSVVIISKLDTDPSKITNQKVEIIVYISKELVTQIKKDRDSKLLLTVFNDDTMFLSTDSSRRDVSKIVGVQFPDSDKPLEGDIRIEYKINDALINKSCELWHGTYWDRDSSPKGSEYNFSNCSFWKTGTLTYTGQTTEKVASFLHKQDMKIVYRPNNTLGRFIKNNENRIPKFGKCEVYKLNCGRYFSLRFNIINITLIIEEHLKSDDATVILENIKEVLVKYYDRFTYYDLYLITDVFDRVVTVDENTLTIVSEIVSVITKINRDVLDESQEKYQTTDTILSYLRKLAGMIEMKGIYHYHDLNMFMIASSVRDSEIVGVGITDCEIECSIKELLGNEADNNIPKIFDMSIRLSQDLFRRIMESISEPRIIILAFYNDALFSTRYSIGQSDIIFGIEILGYELVENDIFLYAKYPTEGYCINWNVEDGSGAWTIVGRMNDSICKFRQQGYLSYITKDITANITKALESIIPSSSSDNDKFQKILSLSYLYDKFESIDVSILTNILSEIIDNDININSIIFENMFSIPKNILVQSQVEHDALSNVLTIINSIGNNLTLNSSFTVKNHFSLIVCSIDTGISAVFDDESNIWCAGGSDENYFGRLTPQDDLVSDIMSTFNGNITPKFISTIFYNDILFIQNEENVPSIIIGMDIPNYDGNLQNELSMDIDGAKYNLEVYTCAYWEYMKYSYGIWWPVTTHIAGAYKNCTFSQGEYFSMIMEDRSRNLTQVLLLINNSSISYPEKLQHIFEIMNQYEKQLEALHISIISTIIKQSDEVTSDLTLIGKIASSLMDINRTVLVQSQDLYNATHEILNHIDIIVTQHITEDMNLQFDNFAILIQGKFAEINFANCERSCTIEIASTKLKDSQNIDAVLSIDQELKDCLVENSLKIHVTIYFNDVLFNEGCIGSKTNIGIIVGVTIPGMDESRWKGSVRFGYKKRRDKADICAYWNWNYDTQNGSLIWGGHWQISQAHLDTLWICTSKIGSTHFAILDIEKNVTSDLENILNGIFPIEEQLERVDLIITTNVDTLSPMDILLIARILGKVASYNGTTHEHVFCISKVMSSLFKVKRTTLRKSQIMYYATDIILHNLDQILLKRQVITEVSDLIAEDNFIVITHKLSNTDIKGLTLGGCRNDTCNSTILYKNTDIIETINHEDFNTALILNDDLLQQIKENKYPIYLIVTVFFKDVLFNEKLRVNYSTSVICGVLLKGLSDPLRGNVSLIYKAKEDDLYDKASCAYWDYEIQEKDGFWKGGIVPRNDKNVLVCDHTHITHFVLLLASSGGIFLKISESKVLDTITNINSVLSLFGIFGILLTALLFDRWRNNIGNQILVHFSFAISIKNIMLYISVGVWDESGSSSMACTITGGILHYSILSEFCWMLIIAILQFKRFVEVLGSPTKYILLKACICGWAFPVIPVFLTLIIDINNYSAGKLGLCYPSGLGLYLGIWLPLLIIIFINSIIFGVIVYNIFHKKTESRDQVNHEILFQWRLALLLFFMLGLTWMFGFLSLSGEYLFMVVFCFVATLQGFVIFMFFIVFNKSTRFLYIQAFKLWLYSNDYGNKFI